MGLNNKNLKIIDQIEQMTEKEILMSMSGPNPWTPELEKAWNKLSMKKITNTYKNIAKPRHIARKRKKFVI